jgi:hypothetical protein
MYNIFADIFFLVGLVMKLIEYLLKKNEANTSSDDLLDMNTLAAAGRILWGAAFSLAILKTIKVYINQSIDCHAVIVSS